MQGVVVHGEQAEEVVLGLRDRLRGPVLVDRSDLELLQVAPVLVRTGVLSLGLVGGQMVVLVAHRISRSPRVGVTPPWVRGAGWYGSQMIRVSIPSKRAMSATSFSIFDSSRARSRFDRLSSISRRPSARLERQPPTTMPSSTITGRIQPPPPSLTCSSCSSATENPRSFQP